MNDLDVVIKSSNNKNGEKLVARTFNVPLSLPGAFYEFLDRSKVDDTCRRAMIALYKYVSASILRRIQRDINDSCRRKGNILNKVQDNNREKQPSLSNTYYRNLFNDSSKKGEIANYLVKNAVIGQYKHLNCKFPALRKLLSNSSLSTVAQFITYNYIERELQVKIANRFKWKLSHVRPQLRGIRRSIESSDKFGTLLNLTSKNDEFVKLRTAIDSMLKSSPKVPGLDINVLEKILNKFQKYHVLHVLLLSTEKLHGIYPKKLIINGKIYNASVIEHQLELFNKFCNTNRKINIHREKIVLTGSFKISVTDVPSILDNIIIEHFELY